MLVVQPLRLQNGGESAVTAVAVFRRLVIEQDRGGSTTVLIDGKGTAMSRLSLVGYAFVGGLAAVVAVNTALSAAVR